MSRTAFRLTTALFITVGLFVVLQAQEPGGKGQPKAKKGKLFELPAFAKAKGGKADSGTILDALRDKKVQEQIGLVPEQIIALEDLAAQAAREMDVLTQQFNALPKEEQAAQIDGFRKDLANYLQGLQADVNKILVPEQLQRLKQMALQMQMQKAGPAEALSSPDVLRQLGINEAQAQQIRERLAMVEQEYRQRLADLEVEKERKILAVFSPAQQDKLRSLIGTIIDKQPAGGKAKGPPMP